jgi:hypothetical protein
VWTRATYPYEDRKAKIQGGWNTWVWRCFISWTDGWASVPGEGYLKGKGSTFRKTGEIDLASGQTTMMEVAHHYMPVAREVVAVNI